MIFNNYVSLPEGRLDWMSLAQMERYTMIHVEGKDLLAPEVPWKSQLMNHVYMSPSSKNAYKLFANEDMSLIIQVGAACSWLGTRGQIQLLKYTGNIIHMSHVK